MGEIGCSGCRYNKDNKYCFYPADGCKWTPPEVSNVRTFETGATRSSGENKLDYEGFLSPRVLERYAQYLHKHRKQEDGTFRESDNWQKGIPLAVYMKSAWRHFIAWWKAHRGLPAENIEDSLCALIFNASGYLHELLKSREEL